MSIFGDAWGWVKDKAGDAYDSLGELGFVDAGERFEYKPELDPNNGYDINADPKAPYNYNGFKDNSAGIDWREYVDARNQDRGYANQQQQVYDMLAAKAAGRGNSVAQNQLAQATANTMAGARSQAASARGGSLAQSSAQRSAMYAGANAMQQAAGQSATLRAQEQAAAERALADQANTQRAQSLHRQQMGKNMGLGIWGRMNEYSGIQMQKKLADDQMKNNRIMGTIGALGSLGTMSSGMGGGGGLPSDERVKRDVAPADKEIESFLSALAAKRYHYKPEAGEDSGQHYGVMAQDVEKSRVGKTMVKNRPDGVKVLDGRPGLGVLLAAMANVHERLSKVEGK